MQIVPTYLFLPGHSVMPGKDNEIALLPKPRGLAAIGGGLAGKESNIDPAMLNSDDVRRRAALGKIEPNRSAR